MFRFLIRDLLWLTVVVALAACWYSDRRDAARRDLAARSRIADQQQALRAKDTHIAAIQARLESTRADERAIREQLTEMVSTQEDKMRFDVGPGYFRRLTNAQ